MTIFQKKVRPLGSHLIDTSSRGEFCLSPSPCSIGCFSGFSDVSHAIRVDPWYVRELRACPKVVDGFRGRIIYGWRVVYARLRVINGWRFIIDGWWHIDRWGIIIRSVILVNDIRSQSADNERRDPVPSMMVLILRSLLRILVLMVPRVSRGDSHNRACESCARSMEKE